jgi:uncharacterized protein YndB with AHSA1/START domain
MSFDLAAHISAMSRTVRNLERDGKPAKAVVTSCVYDTTVDDLWDAIVTADRRRRWFGVVDGDLRLGGKYKIEGNAGGTITECVPRERIAATWEFGGGVTWVVARLTPEGRGARLELEHAAVIDPRWGQFGPGAVGIGWDLWFMGLARHLDSPQAEKPPEAAETWFTTDEARNVIRISGDGWALAAIKAGEDEAVALASAETTRKFYTGEAPPPEM